MDKPVKKIIYGQEVRDKILRGVAVTERAVGTTLGSKGRNVALEKNWGSPIILHDGVSVARDIALEDPFENQAAQLVINAAQNTNNEAGDGTTTATILTHAIVKEALPIVSSGTNPMVIRKGIEKAVPAIIAELKKLARPIKTFDEMKQIATISAADESMGDLIATAIKKVGENGVVTVQEGTGSTIEVEYKEGMDLPKGYISPYLITDPARMEVVYEMEKRKGKTGIESSFPYIVVVNEKLDNAKLAAIYQTIWQTDNSAKIIFIADDFEPEAMQSIIISKLRSGSRLAALKSPEFGEHRTNLLIDIATVTGGKVIGGAAGVPIDQVKIDDIGQVEKVIISRDQTLLIGGQGKDKDIQDRIAALKKLLQDSKEEGQRDKLQSRLAKLIGGVAVISVGAPSETEMREKKERVYDAVNATKAAVAEGVVPGGGVALIRASQVLDTMDVTPQESIGVDIVRQALKYPLKRLIENVGTEDPGYAIGKILEHKNPDWGYDVDSETFTDLVKKGIIDPVKVTRSALQNAASIATMLVTTDCMIVYKREEKSKKEEDIEGIGTLP